MRINSISPKFHTNSYIKPQQAQMPAVNNAQETFTFPSYSLCKVAFLGKNHVHSEVDNIDYFRFKQMSPNAKEFYRKKCEIYHRTAIEKELQNKDKKHLPLMDDKSMKQFIDVCNIYKNMKDSPIICLGRSPKWFLNGALWLKDGIENYKFVAFSGHWYPRDLRTNDLYKCEKFAPTEEEKKAYKRYLNKVGASPEDIVEVCKKTGKKVVITDYIGFGKGFCSFLDLMSEYAEEDGILEEFANSIRIVTIGCEEYRSEFFHPEDDIPYPRVQMPERLREYSNVIEQEYHDMPLNVFEQMLINENTNECRSTYYPHEAWTAYKPYNVKTGMIGKKKLEELREKNPRYLNNFTPAMCDFRNLLNFRILDYMEQNGILRESLNSKQWD